MSSAPVADAPDAAHVTAFVAGLLHDYHAVADAPDRWSVLAPRHAGAAAEALPVADTHKVLLPVLELLAAAGDDPAVASRLRRQRHRQAVLREELGRVVDALDALDVPFVVERGPAVARFYPKGWPRESNDIDVLLRRDDDVARVLDHLAGLGYFVARPIVFQRFGGSVRWTGVALNRQRADLPHPVYLDLATGVLAATSRRPLPLADEDWDAVERADVAGVSVPVLGRRAVSTLFAIELLEREEALARDVLDLWALLGDVAADPVGPLVRHADHGDGLRATADLADLASAVALPELAEPLAALGRAAREASGPVGRGARPPAARLERLADGLYRSLRRVDRSLALATVERFPASVWYRLGLPVYAYPPGPDGPRRGSGGAVVGSLALHRARIRPVATRSVVEQSFGCPWPADPFGPLSAIELEAWQLALADDLGAVTPERPDPVHVVESAALTTKGSPARTVGVRRDGLLAAAGRVLRCRDPLSGVEDLRVEGLCAVRPLPADAAPGAVDEFLGRLPDHLRIAVETLTRGPGTELAEPLQRAGFVPRLVSVRRPAAGLTDVSTDIVEMREQDEGFVLHSLAVACVRGALDGRRRTPEEILPVVRRLFLPLTGPDRLTLVALDGDRPVGHITATIERDPYRPGLIANVIDVLILPEAKGRGLSHRLTAALAQVMAARGVQTMESEVILDSSPGLASLRRSLAEAGWVEDRIMWVRDAAVEPGASADGRTRADARDAAVTAAAG